MEHEPRQLKRLLRELGALAYEEELRRALMPLANAFVSWRDGALASSALAERIHEFHQGPARDLWSRYSPGVLKAAVAHAIATGVLERDRVPAELLDHLAAAISFFESQRDEE